MVSELGDAKITLVLDDAALRDTLREVRDQTKKETRKEDGAKRNRDGLTGMASGSSTGVDDDMLRRLIRREQVRKGRSVRTRAAARKERERLKNRSAFERFKDSAAVQAGKAKKAGLGKATRFARKAIGIAAAVAVVREFVPARAAVTGEDSLDFQALQGTKNLINYASSLFSARTEAGQVEATATFGGEVGTDNARLDRNIKRFEETEEVSNDFATFIDEMVRFQGGGAKSKYFDGVVSDVQDFTSFGAGGTAAAKRAADRARAAGTAGASSFR